MIALIPLVNEGIDFEFPFDDKRLFEKRLKEATTQLKLPKGVTATTEGTTVVLKSFDSFVQGKIITPINEKSLEDIKEQINSGLT